MDYPCAIKFRDFGFSRFGFIVRTDRQTLRQTEWQTRMIDDYYTDATTVGASNETEMSLA